MNSATIVQKLWNYCNVLRDDGMTEYVGAITSSSSPWDTPSDKAALEQLRLISGDLAGTETVDVANA